MVEEEMSRKLQKEVIVKTTYEGDEMSLYSLGVL
jgi:hypothetical protein